MIPTRETVLEKAVKCPAPPVAIEAFWDGDSTGWFVVLTLLYPEPSGSRFRRALMTIANWCRWHPETLYREYDLAVMCGLDGDLRLINGQVPSWPEAAWAEKVGAALAVSLGVPFFFPSPNHPEDSCPRWWQKDQAYPCRRCGIPLLQRKSCSYRGVCGVCHIAEEREKKEAEWSPEEMSGPRCEICGKPVKASLAASARCSACVDRYNDYRCSICETNVLTLRTIAHTGICSRCDLRAKVSELAEADRQVIRVATREGGMFAGIKAVRNLIECTLHDAVLAIEEVNGRDKSA